MKKYDVRFCNCGRVHFIEQEKVDKAIESGKQVLIICNNCGNSYVVGADKEQDENGKTIYMMYSSDMRNKTLDDTSKIESIVFTAGEQIRMMTGGEATFYGNNTFIDWETEKPDNITNEKWHEMRKTVHVQHTINWIKDDNKLGQMSHYYTGIDWKGTKYEKTWH
jgi:hypothetical protein